jgi:protocatechuate 3,4-dioxygenase beta subunit
MRPLHILLFGLFFTALGAQASIFGSLRGVVHDPQHRPVQGAMVMVRAKSSDWSKTANTDANGEFAFNAIPIGEYTVTVANPGFEQAE